MTKTLEGWTILFDLDGTLVHTAPDLLASLDHVLASEGLGAVPMTEVHAMIGRGANAMIRQGMLFNGVDPDDYNFDILWDRFIAYYSANIADHSFPFEGVVETLQALKEWGATLAVCTNKPQGLSDTLLKALELDSFFAAVIGSDSVLDMKPHGDHILLTINAADGMPHKSIMIGDSQTDKKAARNAGLPFIFVPFGYETASLEDIGADIVVSHYSDMLAAIEHLASNSA